ncbi:MAG: MYG1 family protein [Bacilli bacterium]|nr:MYG1 family protein [Bacilli bacterium]
MTIKITKNINEANLITHDGKFHPDDVFSTMFLSKIVENPVVYRASVKDVPKEYNGIMYDIGFGKFDHHGPDARYREDSPIKYCSFGLLWEEYGHEYLKKINPIDENLLYNRIVEKLIKQIDGIDNGLFPKIEAEYKLLDLDSIIDMFNRTWDDPAENDQNFLVAIDIAEVIFDRLVKRENSNIKATKLVEEEIDKVKDNILILENFMPYQEAIFNSKKDKAKEVKILVYPSNRGGYDIKPMTISKESKELLINFPKSYRGMHGEELARLSGIKTARFVHASGFLASADTLEDALLLAKKALENKE